MTTTSAPVPGRPGATTIRESMDSVRKTAVVAGVFYLITFLAIATLALYGPVHEADYIVGPGPDTGVLFGGLVEIIVALACIGTAVVLYPVVKRQNEASALGFVAVRVLEAATIFVGVASLFTIVSLRRAGVGADALLTGKTLLAQYDSMFLVGQSLLPAVNALLLGSLMYRSHLVPRILPLLGLIGAPLLVAGVIGTMFGAWEPASTPTALLALPIAIWEFSLGVYLVVKGFRPTAVAKLYNIEAEPVTA